MDFTLSIEENEDFFTNKMITFEKRYILQHYFKNRIKINEVERRILENCHTDEIEPIALIGYLLGDKSPLNIFRLRLGSFFKSDLELAKCCKDLITEKDIKDAEAILFHYEYEENDHIERPIFEYYYKRPKTN
ncbi:hypothetical protein [Olleya sp. AS48]|jgi:hypothetical protein|uniref:hypothetical protein n=1 Tax=Olleya sp. AS48 TaxID=3135774 RepID=UPI00317BAFB8|tara:strand:+ start:223 stop:621 length:399 start_codon:yes stop_codon:yes gene_type:complete